MKSQPPTIRALPGPKITEIEDLAAWLGLTTALVNELSQNAHDEYHEFRIPKKQGGTRLIYPPSKRLKVVQRRILDRLVQAVKFPRWVTGGVLKRSIVTHAQVHLGQKMLATFDVQNFFPSTTCDHLAGILTKFGIDGQAARAILELVTYQGCLPQGAPTSTFFANLALDRADRRIDAICRKHKLRFSRYIDDIALSGNTDLRPFRSAVCDAIESAGFTVAAKKTRFMEASQCQVVTALVVNKVLRPSSEFLEDLKSQIWLCREAGAYAVAVESGRTLPELKSELNGRIAFVRSVNEARGASLSKLMYDINWKVPKD